VAIKGNKLDGIFDGMNMTQMIKESTHITEHSETTLDIMATTSLDLVQRVKVGIPSLSNHRDITAFIKLTKSRWKGPKRTVFNYKDARWEEINRELRETEVYGIESIDDQVEKWEKLFWNIINKHIIQKQIRMDVSNKPWMKQEIKNLRRKKEKVYIKAKRMNKDRYWTKFNRLRNEIKKKIKQAKEEEDKKTAEKIRQSEGRDEKLWWALVKSFYNKNANRKADSPHLLVNNTLIESTKQKAEEFNKYFANITRLDTSGTEPLPEMPETEEGLKKVSIPYLTVRDTLRNLNPNKSSGPDRISTHMRKETADVIADPLCRIFNYSLARGELPNRWKNANVVPIHKKGPKEEVSNYRPVSLLPVAGKVFERCIHTEVIDYMLTENKLSGLQGAFIPGRSTTGQILELYNFTVNEMDKGKSCRMIFCDVSKAFDKVWHQGIIFKLKRAGVGGTLLKWFTSYLQNRSQRVVIEGAESENESINAGVPQGSILGPLLFLVYINDLIDEIQTNIRVYADDSTVYLSFDDPLEAASDLEADLEKVQKWATKWLVSFNPKKTESVTFTRKRNLAIPEIRMNGEIIKDSDSHKHLGLTLQKNGKWSIHIEECVNRATKRVDVLRGLMYRLDRKSLEKIYMSFIRPLLEYSSVVFGNCTGMEKAKLEGVQLAAARVVLGATRGTSHAKMYKDLGWMNLEERRKKQRIKTFFKIMKDKKTPESLKSLIPMQTAERTVHRVRSKDKLSQPLAKTVAFYDSFFPATTKEWNELTPEARSCSTTEALEEHLQQPRKPPSYYYEGTRQGQILHNRLRLGCSSLKLHLHEKNIVDSPECECGMNMETPVHFLLECRRCGELRDNLFREIEFCLSLPVEVLLYGSEELTDQQNKKMFEEVQKFILKTERFKK
jgi:hypothetical protein